MDPELKDTLMGVWVVVLGVGLVAFIVSVVRENGLRQRRAVEQRAEQVEESQQALSAAQTVYGSVVSLYLNDEARALAMKGTKRPRNRCVHCDKTWFPRGADLAEECGNCGDASIIIFDVPLSESERESLLNARENLLSALQRSYALRGH